MLDTYLYLLSQLHESDQRKLEENQRKLEETQGQMAEVLKNSRETTRLLNESLSQTAALQKQLAEMMRKIDQKDNILLSYGCCVFRMLSSLIFLL